MEYALILVLVAVVVVAGLTLFGGALNSLYTDDRQCSIGGVHRKRYTKVDGASRIRSTIV